MALTKEMKIAIIDYTLTFSKGLIEDADLTGEAYERGLVTRDEIENYIEECRDLLIESIGSKAT